MRLLHLPNLADGTPKSAMRSFPRSTTRASGCWLADFHGKSPDKNAAGRVLILQSCNMQTLAGKLDTWLSQMDHDQVQPFTNLNRSAYFGKNFKSITI